MTEIVSLSTRQKLIYGMIGFENQTANSVHTKMKKLDPEIKINGIADNLLKLHRKKLIDRKMIDGYWNYKLPEKSNIQVVAKERKTKNNKHKDIVKSFDKKPVPARVFIFLCKNINKRVGMKQIAKMLNRDTVPGSVYGQLKTYYNDGYLQISDTNPIVYKVLPDIINAEKSPKTDRVKTPPAVVEKEVQVEMFEKPPEPQVQQLPDFQNLNMGDTINSIIQLQQQVTVYKAALEHIASILEQAGIIESE